MEAQGGGAVAAGVIGGLAAGALLGAALSKAQAAPAYGYGRLAPVYGYEAPPVVRYRPAPVVREYGDGPVYRRPRPVRVYEDGDDGYRCVEYGFRRDCDRPHGYGGWEPGGWSRSLPGYPSRNRHDRLSAAQLSVHIGPMSNFARPLAWLLLAALIFVTLAPIGLRPVSGLPVGLERFGAFAALGFLFAYGYPHRRWEVLALVTLAGAGLESLQLLEATRHGRLGDFLVKAAGGGFGVAGAMVLTRLSMRPGMPLGRP